jgi:3-hydroxyacyl-CoA dehydrogenase
MLLTAETVPADEALRWGLIDAVCPGDRLIDQARDVLGEAAEIQRTCQRTERLQDEAAVDAALQEAAERVAGVPEEIIAPREIIAAVKIGVQQSVQAGMLAEQQAFARCMATRPTRNKIYLFFATSRAGKVPDLADAQPTPVARAAVVGLGSMGTGIAHALALADVPVVIVDQNAEALERGMGKIQKALQRRVGQGKITDERAARVLQRATTSTRLEDIADVDVVVESVYEDVGVKRSVLAQLERVCPAHAILASNTSTINLDQLAEGMDYPERLVGMHFFNPAHRMPLVEVIRRTTTSPTVVATIAQLAKRLRKTAVVVANREGFLVNRVFVPYLQEAFWLLQEGVPAPSIDAAAIRFGFPMGPLVLIDMAGLDILVHAHRVLERAFPHHGPLSSIASRLVEGGHLGQKTGSGIYRYQPGDFTPQPSEATDAIIAEVQGRSGRTAGEFQEREIIERLVLRMVNEAFYVVEQGIASCDSDLDVAMVLGTGFPDYRGGVLKYASDLGLESVLGRLQDLREQCGERFSPCQQLREMKGVR